MPESTLTNIVIINKVCPGKGKKPLKIVYDPAIKQGKLTKFNGYRGASKKPMRKRGICPNCHKEVSLTKIDEVCGSHHPQTTKNGHIRKSKIPKFAQLSYAVYLSAELVAKLSVSAKEHGVTVEEFINYILTKKTDELLEQSSAAEKLKKGFANVKPIKKNGSL